jgi:hypothetical protein
MDESQSHKKRIYKKWTGIELDWLRKNWYKYTYEEMKALLNRSRRHIELTCRNLGFYKLYKPRTKLCFNKDDILKISDEKFARYHSYLILDYITGNIYKVGIVFGHKEDFAEKIVQEMTEFVKTTKIIKNRQGLRKGAVYYLKKPIPICAICKSPFSKFVNVKKVPPLKEEFLKKVMGCKLTPEQRIQIKKLYKDGRSIKELITLYNLSKSTIKRIIKERDHLINKYNIVEKIVE